MSDIILTTINAKYIHASLGLRYLYANLGGLQSRTTLLEFTIERWPIDIAEAILQHNPRVVGLGVYIWNIVQSTELVRLIKTLSPSTQIVIGGPEVSYEWEESEIFAYCDYLVRGQADLAFAELAEQILSGAPPEHKLIDPPVPTMADLAFPYQYYTPEDIRHRLIYVEASRGCPFKCEFCLSSLDKTAWPFEQDKFFAEMSALYARGARHFKFVDRTFNLKIKNTLRILEFFLERMSEELFLHFEIIPDHLPDALKEMLTLFPAGSLQFEIGVQTFTPHVQQLISRKQDNEKTKENIRWLRKNTQAHLHTDLIFGLPGETLESFGVSFDQLYALNPHEIQLGILKRLKGSPIIRHSEAFAMRYNPAPPYNVLATKDVDFATVQRMNRFARYWDMIGNSGRFKESLPLIMTPNPFDSFLALADWLFEQTQQTTKISLARLFSLIYDYADLIADDETTNALRNRLELDFGNTGIKGLAPWRKEKKISESTAERRAIRQQRHAL